ncbi:hypothetical protein Tco_0566161 [Tanacetum coccineum]
MAKPLVASGSLRKRPTWMELYTPIKLVLWRRAILNNPSIPMLQDVKSYLGKCFAMKDLGEAAYILESRTTRARYFTGVDLNERLRVSATLMFGSSDGSDTSSSQIDMCSILNEDSRMDIGNSFLGSDVVPTI